MTPLQGEGEQQQLRIIDSCGIGVGGEGLEGTLVDRNVFVFASSAAARAGAVSEAVGSEI